MAQMNVENVALGYNGRSVLEAVSLHIREREMLALVGANGAGKTTLLRGLARLLTPRRGAILVDGRDIGRLSVRETAQNIALTPQQADGSWPLTVEETVALGRTPHRGWLLPFDKRDREIIARALHRTDLWKLRQRGITTLSGGERQRVLIARALVQEPAILLLDEPTANLDLRYQDMILTLVRSLAEDQGLAVVITMHDLNLAALYAHRMALLAEKRLLAVGTPDEVLTEENLARAYGASVVVIRHPIFHTPLVVPNASRSKGH